MALQSNHDQNSLQATIGNSHHLIHDFYKRKVIQISEYKYFTDSLQLTVAWCTLLEF